ncbi:MAG: aminomethyl-transferring glycine dehydrogenase [Bacteroidota bacterium]
MGITVKEEFKSRHIGLSEEEKDKMLQSINASSIDELINQTIPNSILLKSDLDLPDALSESDYLNHIKSIAGKNKVFKSYMGHGYYPTITPGVIKRNILENPGWYTAYTPYQAEIAQGRLEALVNFQTMIVDLTGMEIANASLLDEGTAAAEAMAMFYGLRKGSKKEADVFLVDNNVYEQTLKVLNTRAEPLGIDLRVVDLFDKEAEHDFDNAFGIYFQYPGGNGEIKNPSDICSKAQEKQLKIAVGTDLLSLVLLEAPGQFGVDVVVGTSQRFGVPMGYGGPHAAFFATKEDYKRSIPGRIIGASLDKFGNPAFRMALQTREQHIKRERATSNICTAQVLLAVMAGMYGVYHGKEGLIRIASNVNALANVFTRSVEEAGFSHLNESFFDTVRISADKEEIEKIKRKAVEANINLWYEENEVLISFDEGKGDSDLTELINIFRAAKGLEPLEEESITPSSSTSINSDLKRRSDFLTHPVFSNYRSEHDLLRYIKELENKDLSLVHSMISLGSCTMKLNASAEMEPISWPEFASIHPFAPLDQVEGYTELISRLEQWLMTITGFDAVSLQPNSGAQGEYAGLMVIRAYHKSRKESHREIALIPSSAHGTNPASAVMAGMKVVIVGCDEKGNVDLADLKNKAKQYSESLAALMVTYPSTHGVFEEDIQEICETVHQSGGLVYMDGANMNAQVGYTSPAMIGADVCHLNLHKTFCIPHGGGGPGVGPIGVAKHLVEFLPGNPFIKTGGDQAISSISAAPWGSSGILPISYGYIAMMGPDGLKEATAISILSANYIQERLKDHYPVLYLGKNGRSAHELIIDCRDFKKVGVEVEDIAKRLMDYGFHAPTVSFPVPGTMMIEPTESESKEEIDRFCDAMISIRKEISEVQNGVFTKEHNVLKNAPHTISSVTNDEWEYDYSREKAAFPLPYLKVKKFWASVSRVDNAYGDRNLMCSCLPVEEYKEEEEVELIES